MRNLGFLISFCFAFMYCKYQKKHVVSYMFMKALPSIPNIYNISSISSINFNPFKNKPSQGFKKKAPPAIPTRVDIAGLRPPTLVVWVVHHPWAALPAPLGLLRGILGGIKADGWRKFMTLIVLLWMVLDVSENSGTPKSSTLVGFSSINHPFCGTPIFGNTLLSLWVFRRSITTWSIYK